MKALRAVREAYWQHLGEWGGVLVGASAFHAVCYTIGAAIEVAS